MNSNFSGTACRQKSECIFITDEENEAAEDAILGALVFNIFEKVPKFTGYCGSTCTVKFEDTDAVKAAWKDV